MSVLSVMGLLGVLALAASYFGVAAVRRVAERRQFLDIPNERSSHTRPTPRGGGLAIVAVVLGGLWFYAALCPGVPWLALGIFTVGAVLIAGVSGWDDLHPLPVRVRFTAHGLAAILAILAFGYWHAVGWPGLGWFSLGLFGVLLTFLWIVGLTNAYNFMDGIDGIAGGQAIVAGVGWAIMGIIVSNPLLTSMGILLAFSSLGFLWFNWPPAKIFMGDVGSAFLGYTFAVLPVIAARSDPRFVLIGILFVWPFVFDTLFTFLRRLIKHENIFTAHRSHLYQRLVIAGFAHQTVTLLYVALALIGVVLAVAFVLDCRHIGIVALAALVISMVGLWFLTVRREHMRCIHPGWRGHGV